MAGPVYDRVFEHLSDDGFDVYPPATKIGVCTAPYIVLKEGTTNQVSDYSSTVTYYDIMCYVPLNEYTKLYEFKESAKDCLEKLRPLLVPTFYETAPYYDDTVKAHMVSVQYRNARKIRRGN